MAGGSLRRRLLLAAAAFTLIAVALAAFGVSALFERHVKRWIDFELNAHLEQVIAGLDRGADGHLAMHREPAHPALP